MPTFHHFLHRINFLLMFWGEDKSLCLQKPYTLSKFEQKAHIKFWVWFKQATAIFRKKHFPFLLNKVLIEVAEPIMIKKDFWWNKFKRQFCERWHNAWYVCISPILYLLTEKFTNPLTKSCYPGQLRAVVGFPTTWIKIHLFRLQKN